MALSIQAIITGILALALALYLTGYIPIKSYLEYRRNKKTGKTPKECGYCAKQNATKRCGGCKNVYYCSVKCQASHWKFGHKKACKSAQNKSGSSKKKKGKTKKSREQKKQEFMQMLASFGSLTGANDVGQDDEDEEKGANALNEKQLREEYAKLIDPDKLKRKFITYYSFKILGFDDTDIPPFEGDPAVGEQRITLNEMVDSMLITKRMIVRDPELKHEMEKKIMRYKQNN